MAWNVYGLECVFGCFKSAVPAVFPPRCIPTPGLFTWWRGRV